MLWLSVTLLALFGSVQGRAVNISNTWVLPEEGFPVFYRYFRDRISWYEADAVCQFHHANLVTETSSVRDVLQWKYNFWVSTPKSVLYSTDAVDTTAQYDAVRAYLKELDISSAVWVGLIRSNPDGDFTWTDYRGLSGEGYWSSAPDARAAPLCAAADPAADYRWEARACGGPTVASFICELPVPQWALGKDGCMVRALPALTALYLPESAAVQLTADCGLAGVKRVQCTGNVKREELLRDLSCNDEDDQSTTQSLTSTSTLWPPTETTFNDQEITTDEVSTANNIVTEQKEINNTPQSNTESPTSYSETEIPTTTKNNLYIHNFAKVSLNKDISLIPIHSNDIPQPEHDNPIGYHHLKTVEENKSYQHRLLHDEMTKLSNLETIFTQPTDHFVPPLVMAKARISDDMTVLSLEEKHAQQIAEQRLQKHNKLVNHTSLKLTPNTSSNSASSTEIPTIINKDQNNSGVLNISIKKDMKSSVPKKYTNKYNEKIKLWKTGDYKIQKAAKIDVISTLPTLISSKETETTTQKLQTDSQNSSEEDPRIDLTVIIKEPGAGSGQQVFYSNHTNTLSRLQQVANVTEANTLQSNDTSTFTETPILSTDPVTDDKPQGTSAVTLNHEVIKITVINDIGSSKSSSPVVYEVSTLIPLFHNNSDEVMISSTTANNNNAISSTIKNKPVTSTTNAGTSGSSTESQQTELQTARHSTTVSPSSNAVTNMQNVGSTIKATVTSHKTTSEAATLATITLLKNVNPTEKVTRIANTTDDITTINEVPTTEKMDLFNHTNNFEDEHELDEHDAESNDDFQSPLLSAANEPLHRPNRSRRPLPPPNAIKKFNPFRILG